MTKVAFADTGAVITGATGGIGRALALELAARKARLALIARQPDRLASLRDECLLAGARQVETWSFDLSATAHIGALISEIEGRMDEPIGLAIHAAGTVLVARVEDYPLDDAVKLLNLNLVAAFALAQALIPGMRSHGGTIGFISSGSAYRSLPYEWAYAASKAGLERLSEAMRVELAGAPIRVRIVSPGPVDTDMMSRPLTIAPAVSLSKPATAPTPQQIAPSILRAFASNSARAEFATRVKIARWLSAFGAEPFDTLLRRRL